MNRVERRALQRQQAAQPRLMPRDRAAARSELRGTVVPNRLERLQQRAERGRLSPVERRSLRRLERAERRLPPAIAQSDRATSRVEQRRNALQGRIERLQQRAERGRLNPVERRALRGLERAQRQLPPALATGPRDRQRTERAARITPQQALRGRFAANFSNPDRAARHNDRARRLAARLAWRLGLFAAHVPWHGPVYWPYAYDDIFNYAFWPGGYEPGYWAYAFDDFYDGIFFPDGAPYVGYAYAGPYYQGADVRQSGADVRQTTGSVRAPRAPMTPGRLPQATRAFCAEQAKGVTAWPFARIEQAVRPINNQKELLAELKKAAAEAAAQFREACPDAVPLTPSGRLEAMTLRLHATLAGIKIVRPALAAFYESLEDEQKARFNEIGPELGESPKAQSEAANCQGAKASLAELPIERIDAIVRPTRAQEATLNGLHDAVARSAAKLAEVCAAATPATPVGRLDAMQQRLEAMIAAAEEIRPALAAFYASLDDEQKAKFNRLNRVSAQSRN
jgi:hypothetical protein